MFEFTYEHCHALDGPHMLHNLTLIITGMIKAPGDLDAFFTSPPPPASKEAVVEATLRAVTKKLISHGQLSSPEALQKLKSLKRENLQKWQSLAQENHLTMAVRFLELFSEQLDSITPTSVDKQAVAALTRHPVEYDQLFVAVCCMLEMGVRWVPLLWSMGKIMKLDGVKPPAQPSIATTMGATPTPVH